MIFVLRGAAEPPDAAGIQLKLVRRTPETVPGGAGKADRFCVADAEAIAALRAEGREVVELRDGWYADDSGGGVAVWGQGKYWEIRDTPFTVREAVRPAADTGQPKAGDGDPVNVRGAIFGV